MKKLVLLLLLAFAFVAYAETTGTINFTYVNATTGLFGYTVNACNSTAQCFSYVCNIDFDGTGVPASAGWCNATLGCYHDGVFYSSGTTYCSGGESNTRFFTCQSNGTWSTEQTCSSDQTCSPVGVGSCSAPSSESSSSGGGATTTPQPALTFVSFPDDFTLVQGTSAVKLVTIKNNGNKTVNNVSVTVTGFTTTVAPSSYSKSFINNETTFSINFSAADNTEVKSHSVTVKASSNEASVTKILGITVEPGEATVQQKIIPNLDAYTALLVQLEENMTELESLGKDVDEVKGLLANARNKLNEANSLIASGDYTAADQLIEESKNVLDLAAEKLNDLGGPGFQLVIDPVIVIAVVAVVGVVAFLIYLMLPSEAKEASMFEMLTEKEKGSVLAKFKGKLRRSNKTKRNVRKK